MIEQYILQALQNEKTVFINGFGEFSKRRVAAKIEEGTLKPPYYELSFLATSVGNALDFLTFVAQQEKISLLEADTRVMAWRTRILQTLEQEHRCALENFGTFAGNDAYFYFTPCILPALNEDFEGMEPIVLPEIQPAPQSECQPEAEQQPETEAEPEIQPEAEQQPETEAEPEIQPDPEQQAEPEVKVATEPEAVSEPESEPEEEPESDAATSSKKHHKGWGIFFFIVVILASVAFLCYIFKDDILLKYNELRDKYFQQPVVADTVAQPAEEESWNWEEDTLALESDSLAADSLAAVTEPTEMVESEPVVQNVAPTQSARKTRTFPRLDFETGKFYVIAGSFYTADKANQHASLKASQGYSPQLLYQAGTTKIRICVAVFNTEAEANDYLTQHSGFWVLQ